MDDDPLERPVLAYAVGAGLCEGPLAGEAVGDQFEVRAYDSHHSLFLALSDEVPDVVVIDDEIALGEKGVLRQLRRRQFLRLPVIVVARRPEVETVVQCMRLGADDVVSWEEAGGQLADKLLRAARNHRLMMKVDNLYEAYARLPECGTLVGVSPEIQDVFATIRKVAQTDASVLVWGESGTGKELVAHAIHGLSRRNEEGQIVCVNCAAIPKDLLESELFGHEKGSFTGADRRRLGSCERADGGTLFLDEIGEMDMGLQAKLLRFLQSHSFSRVGSTETIHVDTRVIAATNRDPIDEVAGKVEGRRLREDLYYRLNVVPIYIPPLRERPEDVPVLARRFLEELSAQYNEYFWDFTPGAMRIMLCYSWPGNVRELRNTIEQIVVLARYHTITPELFPEHVRQGAAQAKEPPLDVGEALAYVSQALREPTPSQPASEEVVPFEEVEKHAILEAIRKCSGDISKAARKLGLSRATIYRKLEKYGVK